ncbi:MAG: hypothetical protein P4L82_11980 [Ancalomicrobiaceae bacterium]|nr:hypothetical protein [Ancalomicrobiaceae bacterium]
MRSMTIDDFSRWAIREELPKSRTPLVLSGRMRRPAGYGGSTGFDLMAPVYGGGGKPGLINEFGLIACDLADDVHPDALAFAAVMGALDEEGVEIGVGEAIIQNLDIEAHRDVVEPAKEFEGLIKTALVAAFERATRTDEAGETRPERGILGLVKHAAVMGLDWRIGLIRLDYVRKGGFARWYRQIVGEMDQFGRVDSREVDGFDQKRRRPYVGAYHRGVLTPDPTEALAMRLEWMMHRAILREARMRLAGRLIEHSLLPPSGSDVPWLVGTPERRIWRVAIEAPTDSTKSLRRKRRRA